MGQGVDGDHVVGDAVVVAGSAECFFEACAVALEVFCVFAYDAEHTGGYCVVAEEAAFVVGDHVVDVGPFFDGHGGADAACGVVGVMAIRECDGFVAGEFVLACSVAEVHGYAMVPVGAGVVVDAAGRW
nr:MAG: hypothetical protein [Bacteriophage sp.]